jgi:hypothetical protein
MLCLLLVGRKEERKRIKRKRELTEEFFFFPQSQPSLAGCATQDFHNC